MIEPLTEINKIQALERKLESLTYDWLRSRGWKQTSSTEGCYWMWSKEIDGNTYLVFTDQAKRIQRAADAETDYSLHPERYEE